jgi:hypothetical protein
MGAPRPQATDRMVGYHTVRAAWPSPYTTTSLLGFSGSQRAVAFSLQIEHLPVLLRHDGFEGLKKGRSGWR